MQAHGSKRIWVFGEVLFDHLPSGEKVLGGAPFNVAWHLTAFGLSPTLVTRVGGDESGARILDAMRHWGMDTSEVQVDDRRPTGRVEVTIADGEPSYDIRADSAWDAIEPPRAQGCDLLYHGSLAARSGVSLDTLRGIRAGGPGQVFMDVNLRQPWWAPSLVRELMHGAHWVKLNHHELEALCTEETGGADLVDRLLANYRLDGVLLTRGEAGAELVRADGAGCTVRPSKSQAVVDTIGAGDAFAAVAILGLLEGWSPRALLARAQQFASVIVGTRGATLEHRSVYEALRRDWSAAE